MLVDSLSCKSQVLGSEWTLCSKAFHQLLRRCPATIDLFATSLNHRLRPGLLFVDGRSAVGGHGCPALVVGRLPDLCLPTLWLDPSGSVQGPPIPGSGAYSGCPILGSTPLVSRPAGASGGGPLLPSKKEGSTQTTSLPPLPPEPPYASADCLSFIERSTRHFGFSKTVARQLTHCRRRSTRVNYQAKWTVFRSWCDRYGHSVSRSLRWLTSLFPALLVFVLLFCCFLPLYAEWCLLLRSSQALFPLRSS